jgi:hypothetical protein
MKVRFKHYRPGQLVVVGESAQLSGTELSVYATYVHWYKIRKHQRGVGFSTHASILGTATPTAVVASDYPAKMPVISEWRLESERQRLFTIWHNGVAEIWFQTIIPK